LEITEGYQCLCDRSGIFSAVGFGIDDRGEPSRASADGGDGEFDKGER
jgi:hypothetical protein